MFTVGDMPDGRELYISNSATDVLFDALALAGCHLARTAWEQHLTMTFANEHRAARGCSGFALTELPWTGNCAAEKAFLLSVVDLALTRFRWDVLPYASPVSAGNLARYREMAGGFTPSPGADPRWLTPPEPDMLRRCPEHDLYVGYYDECRLEEWR